MSLPNQVEQWRQYATWEARDIPVDLVLALIAHESGGIAGIRANRRTKYEVAIPTDTGGTEQLSHAYGLLQVIPALVDEWNKSHPEKVTVQDLKGKDERAVRLQIRIGAWYLAACIRHLHEFDPVEFPGKSGRDATTEQLKLALVAYAAGWSGGLRPKLEQLKAQGLPLTLGELQRAFPTWGQSKGGQWINKPVQGARSVWSQYETQTGGPGGHRVLGRGIKTTTAAMKRQQLANLPPEEKEQKKEFFRSLVPIGLLLAAGIAGKGGGLLGSLFGSGDENDQEEDEDDDYDDKDPGEVQYNRGYQQGYEDGYDDGLEDAESA